MKATKLHISSLEFAEVTPDYKFAIWGEFYMEIGGVFFPFEHWNDAASAVLDMWTECMIDFVQNKKRQCTLCFMDGPYVVRLYARANNRITVVCRERCGGEYGRVTVELSEFLQNLLECTSFFVEECRQKATSYFERNETFQKLMASYRVLREIVVKLE